MKYFTEFNVNEGNIIEDIKSLLIKNTGVKEWQVFWNESNDVWSDMGNPDSYDPDEFSGRLTMIKVYEKGDEKKYTKKIEASLKKDHLYFKSEHTYDPNSEDWDDYETPHSSWSYDIFV